MDPGEQRHHPRLTPRNTSIRNGFLSGRVLDLSLGGLSLESTTGLRIGSRHTFRVDLGDRRFRIAGVVRWCRLTETVGKGGGEVVAIYRAGLAFSRPLELFSDRGLQNSADWFDPEVRVPR